MGITSEPTIKLQNPEGLADNLETGIGEAGWYYELIPKELRLRLPVCGLASVAIASVLEDMGEKVKVVHCKPQLAFDPQETHVFPIVYGDDRPPMIIDATFSSFLRFAGLTPEGILAGQQDAYPQDKILTFERGDSRRPATLLATRAMKAKYSRPPEWKPGYIAPPFENLKMIEIYQKLTEFWNPMYFHEFEPSNDTIKAAKYVSDFIDPNNLMLTER